MTHAYDDNELLNPEEVLIESGFDGFKSAIEILLNQAMAIERARYLKAERYERTEERQGYANGTKPKTVKSRVGKLHLAVPQTRDSSFYPKSLEKGLRSERALKLSLAEMYLTGVSTRKVARITEELCGFEVTRMEVSRATVALDEEFEKWRNRPLGAFAYLILDARYEKVRVEGIVRSVAVLVAIGVTAEGVRQPLGVSVSLSEHEVHWRAFMQGLVRRGMHGVQFIISDAHEGLKAGREMVFPGIPWQRCQFHLQQNAQAHVPKKSQKEEVASDIRSIFNAPNLVEAERLLKMTVEKWSTPAEKLSHWMDENLREGMTVFKFQEESLRRKLRTSNLIERAVNREIKRRTRVVGIFPNEASCLRLVTGVLIEIGDEWETGRNYF